MIKRLRGQLVLGNQFFLLLQSRCHKAGHNGCNKEKQEQDDILAAVDDEGIARIRIEEIKQHQAHDRGHDAIG